MPASPLTQTRTYNQLLWLFPGHRFTLKALDTGQYAVWIDNDPKAKYAERSWEEVMRRAVMDAWQRKD